MRLPYLAAVLLAGVLQSGCLPAALRRATTPTPLSSSYPQHILYTDAQVETFLQRYPDLASSPFQNDPPEDVLERLEIDLDRLKVLDFLVGDCPTLTVYDLSPSYELVVDHNPCTGLLIRIRPK